MPRPDSPPPEWATNRARNHVPATGRCGRYRGRLDLSLGGDPPVGDSHVTGVLVYFDGPVPPNCIPNCSASDRRSALAQFSRILPSTTL